jgi:peptidoglycan/LPS O-acetylase OafA/YrhL
MAATENSTGKLIFADQLRGIAALLVVINHYTGIYWEGRQIVAQYIFSPIQPGPIPALAHAIIGIPFNPGALGVALFFIISGCVIPYSFNHHTSISFLIARMLRIYPTYLAAMVVGLMARIISARYWGHPLELQPAVIIGNGLLLQDLLGLPSIDLVNWTLTIELKFYVLFALFYKMIMRWRAWFVLVAGALAIAFNLMDIALTPNLSARGQAIAATLGNEAMCVAFMMLGTLFFLNIRGLLSTAGLIAASIVGLGLFGACWSVGSMSYQFPFITKNYVFGWAAFMLCYLGRRWFVSISVLRFFSAISYPLYLVHPMVGFVVIAILMMGFGLSFASAASIASASAILFACAIHLMIERRSISWGRAMGRKARTNAATA